MSIESHCEYDIVKSAEDYRQIVMLCQKKHPIRMQYYSFF